MQETRYFITTGVNCMNAQRPFVDKHSHMYSGTIPLGL